MGVRRDEPVGRGEGEAPRVFLVDDHPMIRSGLTVLLEQAGVRVCGQAADGAGLVAGVARSRPDLVLLDLTLGEEDGVALLRTFALAWPAVPVLVYSMHEDAFHVERAFAAGARGYVTKREPADALLAAIAQVVAGVVHVSPVAAQAVALRLRHGPAAGDVGELTAQERRVYALLAVGATTPDIAGELGVSRRTVESYYARMQNKLDLPGMKELRQHAILRGRVP